MSADYELYTAVLEDDLEAAQEAYERASYKLYCLDQLVRQPMGTFALLMAEGDPVEGLRILKGGYVGGTQVA